VARTKSGQKQRARRSGAITRLAPDRWLIGVEGEQDPVTGERRRHTRVAQGDREQAEIALARLQLLKADQLLHRSTGARSVLAACELYLREAHTEKENLARCALPPIGVVHHAVVRLPSVYPIYDLRFAANQGCVEKWAANQSGLVLVGQQALFAHDNTHHALEMGMAAGALAGAPDGWVAHAWGRGAGAVPRPCGRGPATFYARSWLDPSVT
jgi:hypothetical protein